MSVMGFLGGLVEPLIGGAERIIDELHDSDEEKAKAKLAINKLAQNFQIELENSYRAEITAKERIMIAELQQSDNYTKRARPSIVYAWIASGVALFILTVLIILFRYVVPDLGIVGQLLMAWMASAGGVVATYTITRGVEKRGTAKDGSKTAAFVSAITGNRQLP